MSAKVFHFRPRVDVEGVLSGEPVTGPDWAGLGSLANWCLGHGGMLVPWAHVEQTVNSGATGSFRFYIAPKTQAVERIWAFHIRASSTVGTTVTITLDSGDDVTGYPVVDSDRTRRSAIYVRERLSAKTNAVGDYQIDIDAVGGNIVVESIACYEQTRAFLDADATDYGTDINSLRTRQPIFDVVGDSAGSVLEAYKNLDCRRAGFFSWAREASNPVAITSGTFADFWPLYPQCFGAIPTRGDTTTTITCAVLARVNSGTAEVRYTPQQSGGSAQTASITSTTYAWVTATVTIDAEEFETTDGRRDTAWEEIQVETRVTTATTLDIIGFCFVRSTTPL